ncbi:hypothetical protein PCASD_02038 [Puccinia coronata f. sp. avenae]|uniref:Uncharacterized protein n=1 Tax=Puccinia coronata f. sp. avenae TaxID=200324 RepID=A0A2N5VQ42_9BASI|nr:hypothetical protein PCASD_02038 [Puccinia coronata f. sp. avenae]
MMASTRAHQKGSSMLRSSTFKSPDISPPAAAAAAAGHHHYIKRAATLSSPAYLPPPHHHPRSAFMPKTESMSDTSATSHVTNTSVESRPSSPLSFASSHPTNPSSLGHVTSPVYPPAHTSPLAVVSFPPPVASPQTGSHPPPQSFVKKNHDQQSLLPSDRVTLDLPSSSIHLEQAMKAEVVDGFGKAVKFEDLIDRDYKTLVIFIRHFRSGYSQRYIKRLSKIAKGEMVLNKKQFNKHYNHSIKGSASTVSVNTSAQSNKCEESHFRDNNWISANGVKVIVIGNGNYQLIESYRAILNCPFPIYTDLSKDQKIYNLMGMKKIKDIKLYHSAEKYCQQQLATNYRIQTLDPNTIGLSDAYRCGTKDHNEPLLCKQESKIAFLSKVLYNAWRMPWKWSGDPQQLGGELVFEPIREEKRIKRKPIKYQFADDLSTQFGSTRSKSSAASTSDHSHHPLQDFAASRLAGHALRKPSCSIKGNNSSIFGRAKNAHSVKDTVQQIQVQCKFIHRMTNYQDHFSIDELMIMSGIRLTSLIQRF